MRLDSVLGELRSRSSSLWNPVIRSKGHVWVATRPDQQGAWAHTGAQVHLTGGTAFWAAVPRSEWPEDAAEIFDIVQGWDRHYGDRCTTLVVIGVKMDHAAVEAALNAALVDPQDLLDGEGQSKWDELEDPFAAWVPDERLVDHGSDDGE